MGTKNSTGYYITKDYRLYLKSFKQSLSVDKMTTLWQDILALIKLRTSLARNNIDQASEEILRFTSKIMTYT